MPTGVGDGGRCRAGLGTVSTGIGGEGSTKFTKVGGGRRAGVADAHAGSGGEGPLAGEGKAVVVGMAGDGDQEEQGSAPLGGMGPDAIGALDAHGLALRSDLLNICSISIMAQNRGVCYQKNGGISPS
jgi:hypothetical protein